MSKKQNIELKNSKGQRHGLCICYYADGKIWYKRRWFNGIGHGVHEFYWSNGRLCFKRYYINGKLVYQELYVENRIEFRI